MTARIDLDQLARRESEQTEWKENVADINDVVETLAAFANDLQNLGGGYVVCGAKEEKDAHGFPKLVRTGLTAARFKEIENIVLARCRDRVSPPLAPLVEELESDDPERRILVFLQPATGSAHTFRRSNEGAKHFVRVSRSTIEARNGLLKDLLVRKGALEPWDRRPCNAATVSDIDLLTLRDALQRMGVFTLDRGIEPYLVEGIQLSPFVPSLCVAEPLSGVLRPRNYAVLLFGREPQRFIPGSFSIFSAYPGLDRTDPVARRLEIPGTLLDQARRLQELLDAEVVTLFDKTNLKSPNAEKYPRRALQEAMVNALAHRDYELVDPARFTSYRDRIELISPGPLPVGVTLENLRAGAVTPRWRNQALAWFLSRLQLAQAEGQGIQTIRSTMKAAGCPPPIFDATEVSVTCILRAHPRFESAKRGERASRGRATKPAAPVKTRSKAKQAKPKTKLAAKPKKTAKRRP
jgi:ATP-dependent DNA helicase RecG